MLLIVAFALLMFAPLQSGERPVPTSRIVPAYPPVAAARRVSGAVLVDVKVTAEGKVTEASVVSGPELLRGSAKKAASLWRFKPSGAGAPQAVRLTFIFHDSSFAPPAKEPAFTCPYQAEVRWLGTAQHNNGMQRTRRSAALLSSKARARR